MTSGRPGSAYEPHSDTAIRLARWRQGATRGMSTADIAANLGIPTATLRRMVQRARARGHPDAIHHPTATPAGHGTSHITHSRERARRAQHQQETRTP